MLSSEFAIFETELATLAKLYSKTLEDDMVQIYWQALRDLPLELVKARLRSYVKRGKFFPKPAEIRPKDDASDGPVMSADAKRSVHIAMMELAEKDPAKNGHLKESLAKNAYEWLNRFDTEPDRARADYSRARFASDLANMAPESPEYAEAMAQGPQSVDIDSARRVLKATIRRCQGAA